MSSDQGPYNGFMEYLALHIKHVGPDSESFGMIPVSVCYNPETIVRDMYDALAYTLKDANLGMASEFALIGSGIKFSLTNLTALINHVQKVKAISDPIFFEAEQLTDENVPQENDITVRVRYSAQNFDLRLRIQVSMKAFRDHLETLLTSSGIPTTTLFLFYVDAFPCKEFTLGSFVSGDEIGEFILRRINRTDEGKTVYFSTKPSE